ncbi:tetratricopeptide repeat protein [Alteromonadaceae bacterium BrNp21-10]|nr:tetratricopeptide repeat protein [Alteromonadaceae bacterium BrNp21-10]
MSVVNKMLNDLEQRQNVPASNAVYSPPKANHRRKILLVLLLGLLVVGIYASFELLGVINAESAPVMSAVASQPNTQPADQTNPALPVIATATVIDDQAEDNQLPQLVEPILVEELIESSPDDDIETDILQHNSTIATQELAEYAQLDNTDNNSEPEAQPSTFRMTAVALTEEQLIEELKQHVQAALAQDDKGLAINKLGELLNKVPTHSKARQKLANLLHAQGRPAAAEQVLREGLLLNHEDSYQRLMLARLLVVKQQPQAAMTLLQDLKPSLEEHVDYHVLIAELARQLGDHELALLTYTHLAGFAPTNARWWLGQAVSADQLGKLDKALMAYQQALELQQLDESVVQFIRQRLQVLGG